MSNRITLPAFAETSVSGNGSELPLHGFVAAAAFAVMPFFAMVLAIVGKLGYTHRYALPTVIGVSVLVAVAAHRAVRGRGVPAMALAIALLGWYDFRHYGVIRTTLGRGPVAAVSTLPASRLLDRVAQDARPRTPFLRLYLHLESVYGPPTKSAPRLVFRQRGG